MVTPRVRKPSLAAARAALRAVADPVRAQGTTRFFKTGKGEYGEGDVFVGGSLPELRAIARAHATLSLADVGKLLRSRIHEERLIALLVLVAQVEAGDDAARAERFAFYLAHLAHVNNWDLVDVSASRVIGAHALATGDAKVLPRLARSKLLWARRVAIVATLAFIRAGQPATTFAIGEQLLGDEHDLIHKAVGWMLREVGKQVSEPALRAFLKKHAPRMPRTTLRYAIERFPAAERKAWLAVERVR